MKTYKLWASTVGTILLAVLVSRAQPLGLGAAMPAADTKMNNVDGKTLTLADLKGKTGTLVIFVCNHCPFVKAWQDRMVQIANEGVKQDIAAVFVNSNDPTAIPEDDVAHMKQLAKDKGYAFPYVVDDGSAVARAFGATRTPEAFLFNADGKLVYHGTIDDSTYDAAKVTKPYLKSAVEALLAGKAVADAETKSVGCSIKFHAQPEK